MYKRQLHTQAGKDAEALQEAVRKVTELEAALDKCRNQEPKIVKDTIDNTKKTLESVITFRQGRTTVDNSQLPNVERIATYLKNHKGASVLIKGYASPEGLSLIHIYTAGGQDVLEMHKTLQANKVLFRMTDERTRVQQRTSTCNS